ncbi:hypothetical protein BY996DRAFT_8687509 [Phakopsora pachyrhizi]|nr:hypothetical protein BY996DRAFT_8687509 [Phakopsora pachyrhizi]
MTMFFKKKLSEKPKEWKQTFLPYTFGNEDNEARLLVATEVCQILKQERNVFKHKIMKNILVGEGNPEQPIPRLIELAKMIFEWAAPKGTSYSNKEIKEKFQDHFHNHEAPWPEVDDQLEKLKKHMSRFRHAFYNIILNIDNSIAKNKFGDVDLEMIYPSSDQQVEDEIERIEKKNSINDNSSGEE